MDHVTESMKKLVLAGIGAAATTAEKVEDVMKEMVKKGESTVEQGKVINEELKHTLKNAADKADDLLDQVDDLSDEALTQLKERIEAAQKKRQEK